MKLLPIACILLVVFSCSEPPQWVAPPGFVERKVVLKQPFVDTAQGEVKLWLPTQLDTMLEWIDFSDCSCCETKKYRFTSTSDCLIQESGFFPVDWCRDSFWRVTIEHQCPIMLKEAIDTAFLAKICHDDDMRMRSIGLPEIEWQNKTVRSIKGRTFAIKDYLSRDALLKKPLKTIEAFTIANGFFINFRFECYQKFCPDFEEMAYLTIESIEIGMR